MPPGKSEYTAQRGTTRYAQIAAELLRRLDAGEWPPGSRFPSRSELARAYRVGEGTIRLALRALKADGRVIVRARGKSCVALGRSTQDTLNRTIAIVLGHSVAATLNGNYQTLIFRGIFGAAGASGCPVLVLQHQSRWRTEFPAGLKHLPLAGVLLIGHFKGAQLLQYETLGKPVVALDRPAEDAKLSYVCVDNFGATYDATMRLIKLGRRRIAFVRSVIASLSAVDPDGRERHDGFRAACRAARLPEHDVQVFTTLGKDPATFRKLVDSRPAFNAVFCSDQIHALQVAKAAARRGIQVPRDLSVAAFRPGSPAALDISGPTPDFEAMGRTAVEMLLKPTQNPAIVRVPAPWHDGATVRLGGQTI